MRIATRGSALALTQARWVGDRLGGAELVEASSDGEPGDKSRFVRGVERVLLQGGAEIGVHSAKDLPGEMPVDLEIAAVPKREDPADVWIGAGGSLEEVPEGARVGTASLRRRAQLLAARPDLRVEELHGNVDTRLRKLADGELDAIVLAAAGLRRLGREEEIGFAIPVDVMVPAAGQGALALQVRAGDEVTSEATAAVNDLKAMRELTAERTVVALLDATCSSPLGAHARVENGRIFIEAFVGLPDGSEWVRDRHDGDDEQPTLAGAELVQRLLGAGAREILDRAEGMA
ncbi:MAG: hydroxymethylbilane synthase [Solirubrobacterales bacterium]|jgi:hydroxymethylbilane synthase|nr:hydroxymethylbilane synthase [Solirubrobacterales bacterium]